MIQPMEQLRRMLETLSGTDGLMLIGSQARADASPNSDCDFSLLVNSDFVPQQCVLALEKAFAPEVQQIVLVELRNSLSVYFRNGDRIEIGYFSSLKQMERNVLGSLIPLERLRSCILFDHTGQIEPYYQRIKRSDFEVQYFDLRQLAFKFLYEFENSSSSHRRSDSYKFYYYYNIALNVAIQLHYLTKNSHADHAYLPKNFMRDHFSPDDAPKCRNLEGTLWLPDANTKKRNLKSFFLEAHERLDVLTEKEKQEHRDFLKWVYQRDFFWNLRDIARHNPRIKPRTVLRSATLTVQQDHPEAHSQLIDLGITDVIDLRDHDEVRENPYLSSFLEGIRYHHQPIDPKDQNADFKLLHEYGSHVQIAYRFFADQCRPQVAYMVRTILQAEGATLIHCHAGKDRTGSFVTLIHWICEASDDIIHQDYLASEMDTTQEHLSVFVELIHKEGGIRSYLNKCGLTEVEIDQFQQKLQAQ